jgi:hypothetical protein
MSSGGNGVIMEKIPFQNLAFVAGVAGTILVVLVAVLVRRAMD